MVLMASIKRSRSVLKSIYSAYPRRGKLRLSKDHGLKRVIEKEKTSLVALEYKISSVLRTTTGRISCHSLFFLVEEL